jgi:hypothetical protein
LAFLTFLTLSDQNEEWKKKNKDQIIARGHRKWYSRRDFLSPILFFCTCTIYFLYSVALIIC